MSDFKEAVTEILNKLEEANGSASQASNDAEAICTSDIEASIGDALSEMEEAREMLLSMSPPEAELTDEGKDAIARAVAETVRSVLDGLDEAVRSALDNLDDEEEEEEEEEAEEDEQ